MPRRRRSNRGRGRQNRVNGQHLNPEGYADDDEESFVVYTVKGIRRNEDGTVSFRIPSLQLWPIMTLQLIMLYFFHGTHTD